MDSSLQIKIHKLITSLGFIPESIAIKENKIYISILANPNKLTHIQKDLIQTHLHNICSDSKFIITYITPKVMEKKPEKIELPNIKQIIAISSGKGGVGKSTIAAQLAFALAKFNPALNIGILDADIYGPSIPTMFNLKGKPELNHEKKLIPYRINNLQIMSMGFMVNIEDPIIWRGPMIQTGIKQLFKDVAWENIDAMIVDMPPGTGDTQLTMAQNIPLTSAIIVSTPQDIALIDARKGWKMFQKLNIPILGLIENMSYFICSNCNTIHHIFGNDKARQEAEKENIPFLGALPLDQIIREKADTGNFLPDLFKPFAQKIVI